MPGRYRAMDSDPGPNSGTDHSAGGVLSAEAVEALIEENIEQLVADPAPDTVLALLDLLDGAGALWQAVLLLLGPIVSRSLPGHSKPEATTRLHKLAQDTPDPV
ncbi:hypothetical protein ACFVT9_07315 [Kitasatospora cineracea]|uniref:hypothetical protein n=1 Tax=Kitasatospora cineracea TaxID=88074 RepID=UPI0036DF8D38